MRFSMEIYSINKITRIKFSCETATLHAIKEKKRKMTEHAQTLWIFTYVNIE